MVNGQMKTLIAWLVPAIVRHAKKHHAKVLKQTQSQNAPASDTVDFVCFSAVFWMKNARRKEIIYSCVTSAALQPVKAASTGNSATSVLQPAVGEVQIVKWMGHFVFIV